MRKHYAILSIILISFSADSAYVLKSELKRNFSDGSSTAFFSGYAYDIHGKRNEKTVYNGIDSTGVKMSTTRFVYEASTGALIREVLLTGADTLSIVSYTYDTRGNMVCAAVSGEQGVENYRDSSVYDANAHCVLKARYSSGQKQFFHSIAYDSTGKKSTDTLYEQVNGTFVPRQATQFYYTSQGFVQSERNFIRPDTVWYPHSIAVMAYSGSALSSVTVYGGDGSQKQMKDSTAFFFDANGNKIREQLFDDEHVQVSLIDYTWEMVSRVTWIAHAGVLNPGLSYYNGTISFTGRNIGDACIAIYNMRGRLVHKVDIKGTVNNKYTVTLPELCSGRYAVQLRSSGIQESISFVVAGTRYN